MPVQQPRLNRIFSLSSSVLFAVMLSACQTPTPYQTADVALPAEYPTQTQEPRAVLAWQDYVNDPSLVQLVNLALNHNHDLQIASLRIAEAQAAYGIQRADLLPTLSGSVGFERARTPAGLSPSGEGFIAESYSVGIGLNQWELDFWGRVRSLNAAALQQFFATQWNQQAVRNSIIQQTAQTYLQLSELEKRIFFAQRSVQNYQNSVRIFKRRYEVGASSKVEYVQAQTLLTNGQTLVSQLQSAKEQAANFLVQLVGQPVQVPQPQLDAIVFKTAVLQTGLPSELLLNRPDIRAAEAQLQSKHANIHAARAAFFPRIALTSNLGTVSTDLDDLFHSGSGMWSFAPSISIPIFTAGRLRNNLVLAEVRRDIAVQEYEKTVQNAFREVSDALVLVKRLGEQLRLQNTGLEAFREAARLAQLRYDSGAVGYLDVLDAQRSLLSSEQQWIQTQSALLKAYVDLYIALGGDSHQTQLAQ